MCIVIGLDDPGRAIGCGNMEQEKENVAAAGAQQPQSVHYHYYGPQYPPAPPYPPQWYYSPKECCPKPHKSSKPGIAGTLLIIAGVFAIIVGASMGSFSLGIGPMFNMMDNGANNNNDLGSIQGQVIFMNSTPVSGANITIVDLGLMASTNASGQYKILNVQVGWHDVRVELPGYKSVIQSVDVTKGMMNMGGSHDMQWYNYVIVDFQLQPGTGEIRIGNAHDTGPDASDWNTNGKAFMQNLGAICLVAGVIGGLLMIIGGYFAIKRTKLPWVITGCVFALIFCSIVGVIAIILVLMSTNEFDRKKKLEEDEEDGDQRGSGGQGERPEPPKHVHERKADMNAPTTKAPEKVSAPYMGAQFPAMAYYPPYPTQYYYPRQY